MKLKKYLIAASVVLAVTAVAETGVLKNEDETAANAEASVTVTESAENRISESSEKQAENYGESVRGIESTRVIEETVYKVPSEVSGIVKLYGEAANGVKSLKPGYTKLEYQELSDLKMNGADSSLLKYADEFITDNTEAAPVTIQKGSAQSSGYFPLYNSPSGCKLTDYSAVKKAECVLNDGVYNIYIEMKPCRDPDYRNSPLAQILTPIDPKLIEEPLNDKRVRRFVRVNSYHLDYSGCYLEASIDARNGHLISLTQVMKCRAEAYGVIKPFGKKASVSGVAVNTAKFYNFKY